MFNKDFSLQTELENAIENGTFDQYRLRAEAESKLYKLGCKTNWNKETIIEYLLNGPSNWLGRKQFEKALDDGSMQEIAKTYHDALAKADTVH